MTFRSVEIVVSPWHFRRWHERLRDSLVRRWPQTRVAFRFERRGEAWPTAVTQLLALERLLLRRGKATLCDALDAGAADIAAAFSTADIVLDFTGEAKIAKDARVLRPLFDGRESDRYAIASLLAGVAPTLALEDVASNETIATGLPSLEAADGLTGGLEAVYSRLILLLEKALASPPRGVDAPPTIADKPRCGMFSFALSNLAFQCAREIYRLCCHSPHWRVGWRFVEGPDVIDSGALTGEPWRVMQNRELDFAADPFPIDWRGHAGVFYEGFDYRANRGDIYFQEFDALGPVGEPVLVLQERWHLSYPFLVVHEGGLYMAPEASTTKGLTLYRCVEFPAKWEPVARLLDGVEAADATIFPHAGKLWMTAVVRDGAGGYSDTLALYHAADLFGPWTPHEQHPVLIDSRYARPAGAVVHRNGALWRPVQDSSSGYGKRIIIMRIDQLDAASFRQTPVSTVSPGGVWPGSRLHTLNRAGRLECIDGVILSPKNQMLRRLTHGLIDWSAGR